MAKLKRRDESEMALVVSKKGEGIFYNGQQVSQGLAELLASAYQGTDLANHNLYDVLRPFSESDLQDNPHKER